MAQQRTTVIVVVNTTMIYKSVMLLRCYSIVRNKQCFGILVTYHITNSQRAWCEYKRRAYRHQILTLFSHLLAAVFVHQTQMFMYWAGTLGA